MATTRVTWRRLAFIGLSIVLSLAVAGVLVVRWALDPATLRPIAETRLSAALGQPVSVGTIRLSFLPVLSVEGGDIVVRGTGDGRSGSIGIRSVRIKPRFWSIFKRPIVVDRVEIDGLTVNARRDAEGRWLLPLPNAAVLSSAGAGNTQSATVDVAEVVLKNGLFTVASDPAVARPTVTPVSSITHMSATVIHGPAETRLENLSGLVGGSRVDGSGRLAATGLALHLAWTNLGRADLPVVFGLLGLSAPHDLVVEGRTPLTLDLVVDRSGALSATGRVVADRGALGTLTLTRFESPLRFARSLLTLQPMTFRAYDGAGSGRVVVNATASPLGWTLDGGLHRVDIDKFLTANTSANGKILGTASIDVRLRGTSAVPVARSIAGTARADVTDGVVRNFGLMAALYEALRLGGRGERDLRFQQLSATFDVAGERANTSDLIARTGELTFLAAGTVGFDQSLALNGTALFSATKSAEMIHSVRELSSLTNDRGEIQVPVTISGSLAAPRFSIDAWSMAKRGVEKELKKRIGDKLREIFKKK